MHYHENKVCLTEVRGKIVKILSYFIADEKQDHQLNNVHSSSDLSYTFIVMHLLFNTSITRIFFK